MQETRANPYELLRQVKAENHPGSGASFRFTLPLASQPTGTAWPGYPDQRV
jgi:hypothetical protein